MLFRPKSSRVQRVRRCSPFLESGLLSGDSVLSSSSSSSSEEWKSIPDIWRSSAEKYGDQVALVDPYHNPPLNMSYKQDGAAVTGLVIAATSLVAVNTTGNAIYDPIGSILVGNHLGMVAIFLIQRNRHALISRVMDDHDMEKVVDSLYDCKSEVIGPGFFRFKAEIDMSAK